MDVKISDYMVAIVIFTFVIVGGVSMISIFNNSNSAVVDSAKFSSFNDTFNVYDDVTASTANLQEGIAGATPDPGVFGVLNSLIQSAWQILKLMFSSLAFMTTVWGGLYTIFGVPVWVGALIGSLAIILIGFTIYSAIFQKDT